MADLRYIERFRTESAWRLVALDAGLTWRTVMLMLKMTGE